MEKQIQSKMYEKMSDTEVISAFEKERAGFYSYLLESIVFLFIKKNSTRFLKLEDKLAENGTVVKKGGDTTTVKPSGILGQMNVDCKKQILIMMRNCIETANRSQINFEES